MCLDRLIESAAPVSGIGFKRIYLRADVSLWGTTFNRPSEFDTWHEARCPIIPCDFTSGVYEAGFHMYRSREDCIKSPGPRHIFLVATVEYEGLICVGTEHGVEVIVSRKMRVLKEPLISMEGRETLRVRLSSPFEYPKGFWLCSKEAWALDTGGASALWDVNTGEVLFLKE